MSDDRLERALNRFEAAAYGDVLMIQTKPCEPYRQAIRALFAERWTEEEVDRWLVGAYGAGFAMGESGVPHDALIRLARDYAKAALERKKAKGMKP